jgi:hypothetical protein
MHQVEIGHAAPEQRVSLAEVVMAQAIWLDPAVGASLIRLRVLAQPCDL